MICILRGEPKVIMIGGASWNKPTEDDHSGAIHYSALPVQSPLNLCMKTLSRYPSNQKFY